MTTVTSASLRRELISGEGRRDPGFPVLDGDHLDRTSTVLVLTAAANRLGVLCATTP